MLRQGRKAQVFALFALLAMGLWITIGPSGLMAWSENLRLLDQRSERLKQVAVERDVLKNRVLLLDPDNTDRDLAGELVHGKLNYVHEDELVLVLRNQ